MTAAGMKREVVFEPVNGPLNDHVDDAYRTKYSNSPYLAAMISERARSATIQILPADKGIESNAL